MSNHVQPFRFNFTQVFICFCSLSSFFFGAYSVTILSLNEQRQVRHSQTTGIKVIQLDRNEETRLIYLDTELVYPVLVSLNLLVTTPNKLPVPPIEDIASLPSTSGGQSPDSNSNSNESDISTIGTTKSSNGSEHSHSDDENWTKFNEVHCYRLLLPRFHIIYQLSIFFSPFIFSIFRTFRDFKNNNNKNSHRSVYFSSLSRHTRFRCKNFQKLKIINLKLHGQVE